MQLSQALAVQEPLDVQGSIDPATDLRHFVWMSALQLQAEAKRAGFAADRLVGLSENALLKELMLASARTLSARDLRAQVLLFSKQIRGTKAVLTDRILQSSRSRTTTRALTARRLTS
jgi:AmiR/NasT family two-component response regulator